MAVIGLVLEVLMAVVVFLQTVWVLVLVLVVGGGGGGGGGVTWDGAIGDGGGAGSTAKH